MTAKNTKQAQKTATKPVAQPAAEQVKQLQTELAEAHKVNAAHQRQVEQLQQELKDAEKLLTSREAYIKRLQEDGKAVVAQKNELIEQLEKITGDHAVAIAKLDELQDAIADAQEDEPVIEVADPVTVVLHKSHPQDSYVRCGMVFTKEPTVLSLDAIGEETLNVLNADVCLDVTLEAADS